MAKYSEKSVSDTTRAEAKKIARGTQKSGQTKEQTKLIAQGIQKGIEQYKKGQSEKKRELDKRLKKAAVGNTENQALADDKATSVSAKNNNLPWILLLLSWLCFVAYVFLTK